MIEQEFGGCRALTDEKIPDLLAYASERGMLDVTVEYVEYRRPDLSQTIRSHLSGEAGS